MNFLSRKPLDLTPEQLQVYLHAEKQESYYTFVLMLTVGAIASTRWPTFAAIYATYGGLMLAGLGTLFGVNVAHKILNNRAEVQDDETFIRSAGVSKSKAKPAEAPVNEDSIPPKE